MSEKVVPAPPLPEQLSDSEKPSSGTFSLENILGENHDNLEHPRFRDEDCTEEDSETAAQPAAEGYCIECEGWFIFLSVRWY